MNLNDFEVEVKKLQEKMKKDKKRNNTTLLLVSATLITYSEVYRILCNSLGSDLVKTILAIPILILVCLNLKNMTKLF